MTTSPRSARQVFRLPTSGPRDGHAKTSAMPRRNGLASEDNGVSSPNLLTLLVRHGLDGLSWKMSSASSARKRVVPLREFSTRLKQSGILAGGLRATRSTSAFPTTVDACSLLQLIDRTPPHASLLTAAYATGIIRRETRGGRTLDPIFERSLKSQSGLAARSSRSKQPMPRRRTPLYRANL